MSEPLRVLFCDDSGGAIQGFLEKVAGPLGEAVKASTASSLEGFRQLVQEGQAFDVVISDLNFEQAGGGPRDGLMILLEARAAWSDAELLLVTAFAGTLGVEDGLELAAAGLAKGNLFSKTQGDDPAQIWARLAERLQGIAQTRNRADDRIGDLEREGFFHRSRALSDAVRGLADHPVDELARQIRHDPATCVHGIITRNFNMHELLRTVGRAARRQSDVLILGETGTGKELVARAIRDTSPRQGKAFVKADLASINKELIPAELFGHEKGAFTGADRARTGYIAEADGGVIFFDEIGNLSAEVQAGLLRVLEDRTYRRLGDNKDRTVDIVVVAATHADLEQEVLEGRFRADLVERLNVVRVRLPPLRERREDIPLLACCFLAELRQRFGVPGFTRFTSDALMLLSRHAWDRNVRQLRNTIERLFSELDDDTDPIGAEHVQKALPELSRSATRSLFQRIFDGDENHTLAELSRRYGEDAVREVIRDTMLKYERPPSDKVCARFFGGMRAGAWRQYAFKRGLTYAAVSAEAEDSGEPESE